MLVGIFSLKTEESGVEFDSGQQKIRDKNMVFFFA